MEALFTIIISISAIFTLLTFFIFRLIDNINRINLERINSEIEVLNKERERIAKDFHDDINPVLASISMRLGLVMERLEFMHATNDCRVKKEVEEIKDIIPMKLIDPAMDNIRKIINELIEQDGLKRELQNIKFDAESNKIDIGIDFNFSAIEREDICLAFKEDLRKIIKEIANNTFKHGNAGSMEIKLYKQDELLILFCSDDGNGFNKEKLTRGIGLKNIESRVNLYKGSLQLQTLQGTGTSYEIKFPYKSLANGIKKEFENMQLKAKKQNIAIHINFNFSVVETEDISAAFKNHLRIILKEISNLIFKCSTLKGADIKLYKKRKKLYLSYSDNGKLRKKKSIQDMDLRNIESIVNLYNGEIAQTTFRRKGNCYKIKFPMQFIKKEKAQELSGRINERIPALKL
jgi:glucose-6-phosphate-specific signal transduction histidine kinase